MRIFLACYTEICYKARARSSARERIIEMDDSHLSFWFEVGRQDYAAGRFLCPMGDAAIRDAYMRGWCSER